MQITIEERGENAIYQILDEGVSLEKGRSLEICSRGLAMLIAGFKADAV